MDVNVKYRKDEGDILDDPTLYRRLVRSLIYLTSTHLISLMLFIKSFNLSPQHLHLAAVRRIIRYLYGSTTHGLFLPKGISLQLVAYSDVDWARCPDTRHSTTGWCMFLGDALISWKYKRQDRILNLQLSQNIGSCLLLVLMLYGYVVFLRNFNFLRLLRHLFMLITLVLFRLRPTLSFLNAPSS